MFSVLLFGQWRTYNFKMINDNTIRELTNKYLESFDIWTRFRGKTFLITGVNGTLGKGLVSLLYFADLKYDLGITIYGSTRNPNLSSEYNSLKYIQYGNEENELCNHHIDYIVHAACPTDRNDFIKSPNQVFLTIIHDTERMLRIARKKNAKMLYLSSDAEYGSWSADHPICESEFGAIDSLNYRSCYPLGKKASEYMCYSDYYENKSSIVIARPSIIFGLFQRYEDTKVMSFFLRCIIEKKDIELNTLGETIKPMIFTLDAANACLFLLLYGKEGEVYNITNDKICMSIRDYAETLCKQFGDGIKVKYNILTDAKAGFAATSKLALDINKAISIGWRPLIGFIEMFDIEVRRFCSR